MSYSYHLIESPNSDASCNLCSNKEGKHLFYQNSPEIGSILIRFCQKCVDHIADGHFETFFSFVKNTIDEIKEPRPCDFVVDLHKPGL